MFHRARSQVCCSEFSFRVGNIFSRISLRPPRWLSGLGHPFNFIEKHELSERSRGHAVDWRVASLMVYESIRLSRMKEFHLEIK